jgi:hypothetical protein
MNGENVIGLSTPSRLVLTNQPLEFVGNVSRLSATMRLAEYFVAAPSGNGRGSRER